MAPAPFALDPTIAALADFAASLGEPRPIRSIDPRFFASSAALFWTMFQIACAWTTAYQGTVETHAGARHLAYSEGVARAPKRSTAADRRAAECRAWGFQS